MEVKRLLCKAFREKPETTRLSRKITKIDFNKLIRMGFNENAFGMSPKAVEAMQSVAESSNYYPDFMATGLKSTIADFYGVSAANVLTASGSSAIIDMLGSVFLEEGDEVLLCMPTFGAFLDMAQVNGAKPVVIPLKEDLSYNLDGLLSAVTERTKMIVVCNPNNPTGTYVSEKALRDFIGKVPSDIVLLFDEAYIEFAEAKDCVSMTETMKECKDHPIIMMRTFSKFYGMAGVRVGYALAQEKVITQINKCSAAWNVSKMAQAAAVAAMKDIDHGTYVKHEMIKCRKYLTDEMRKLGCKVYDSQTNFIYFDSHRNPRDLTMKLIEKGIIIGAFEISRVSVSTMENCRYFIKCLHEILEEKEGVIE